MEYYKDLLENDFGRKKGYKKASTFNFIVGVLIIALSGLYSWRYFQEKEFFLILAGIAFLLLGIINISRSFDFNIEKFFGKAFVKINDTSFTLKTSPFKKEVKSILWQDIENVHYTAGRFTFLKKDGTSVKFSVIELNYTSIQEIKSIVSKYAELNDITQE